MVSLNKQNCTGNYPRQPNLLCTACKHSQKQYNTFLIGFNHTTLKTWNFLLTQVSRVILCSCFKWCENTTNLGEIPVLVGFWSVPMQTRKRSKPQKCPGLIPTLPQYLRDRQGIVNVLLQWSTARAGPSHEAMWAKPWDPNWHGSHAGLLLQRLVAVGS